MLKVRYLLLIFCIVSLLRVTSFKECVLLSREPWYTVWWCTAVIPVLLSPVALLLPTERSGEAHVENRAEHAGHLSSFGSIHFSYPSDNTIYAMFLRGLHAPAELGVDLVFDD